MYSKTKVVRRLLETPLTHRGWHRDDVPENSLLSFEKSIEQGYSIELDIHQLLDGELIVFHDENLKRMTGHDINLSEATYSEIRDLKLLNSSERIPTFSEVLQCVDGRVPLLLELKTEKSHRKTGKLEETLLPLLRNYSGDFAVQSFNPFSVLWFKNNAPDLARGLLSRQFDISDFNCFQKYYLRNLVLLPLVRPDFICYQWDIVDKLALKFARKVLGLPVIVFVIRNEEERSRMIDYYDNMIFEDFRPQI